MTRRNAIAALLGATGCAAAMRDAYADTANGFFVLPGENSNPPMYPAIKINVHKIDRFIGTD
jgi:hypothetical protein